MKLHISRSPYEAGAMCGVSEETEYMMNVSFYLEGNKATKYRLGGHGKKPFTEWCEECINSYDMAMYMLGTELA